MVEPVVAACPVLRDDMTQDVDPVGDRAGDLVPVVAPLLRAALAVVGANVSGASAWGGAL